MSYYSARLLFIILVDDGRPKKKNDYDESVFVFRARDFDQAFERALEIGRAQEKSYRNGTGQNVRWALVEISTLDYVGRKLDGVAVASRLHSRISSAPISYNRSFHPEKS